MIVADLQHFLDMPDDVPAPARRMAEHLAMITRAATAGDPGVRWISALTCNRRPERKACTGHLALCRTDIPSSIEWACCVCGDAGSISGWARTPFDLRRSDIERAADSGVDLTISSEVAGTLRDIDALDSTSERIVYRCRVAPGAAVLLHATTDELEQLVDAVAAEANHEHSRTRQKRLDAAFEILADELDRRTDR